MQKQDKSLGTTSATNARMRQVTHDEPLPGSIRAGIKGCTCPISINAYGAGVLIDAKVMYWVGLYCPMHTLK